MKLILSFFLFISFLSIGKGYTQNRLDSIFVKWNLSTFSSLERRIESGADSIQIIRYKNRLSVIATYLNIKNTRDVNGESIRYKFLKKLFQENEKLPLLKFYIIEANESGAKVLLRNFVFYVDSNNNAFIDFYSNVNQEWHLRGRCQVEDFFIDDKLNNYFAQPWKGINNDDVIVTRIENNTVKETEYFLYGTMSKASSIKRVLDCYKVENFIK